MNCHPTVRGAGGVWRWGGRGAEVHSFSTFIHSELLQAKHMLGTTLGSQAPEV